MNPEVEASPELQEKESVSIPGQGTVCRPACRSWPRSELKNPQKLTKATKKQPVRKKRCSAWNSHLRLRSLRFLLLNLGAVFRLNVTCRNAQRGRGTGWLVAMSRAFGASFCLFVFSAFSCGKSLRRRIH